MKRKVLLLALGAVGLVALLFFLLGGRQEKDLTYQDYVADYEQLSLSQVEEKIAQGDSFYLYTGRSTCQYCQAFVPKLAQAVESQKATVYYLDSEGLDQDADFLDYTASYGIKTVPNFSYYKDGQLLRSLTQGSQATVQQIENFL